MVLQFLQSETESQATVAQVLPDPGNHLVLEPFAVLLKNKSQLGLTSWHVQAYELE